MSKRKAQYTTFEGHKLTPKEARFIDEYIATGNARQSVLNAGYETKAPGQYANTMLHKVYIWNEIQHRLEEGKQNSIADMNEIMQYYTDVMRGEVKDQFGLEAPLGERTKAASELARRYDAFTKNNEKLNGDKPGFTITIDWERD